METIRVMLVDDHALFRRGVAAVLTEDQGFEVVGEASNGAEAVERAAELMPDVILMDVYMPQCDGITATRLIKSRLPYVNIVMLTVSDTDRSLFEALKAGALGYLLKKIDPVELYDMLRRAARGEAPLAPGLAVRVVEEFARLSRGDGHQNEGITARERDVLEHIARGASNKEIAATLKISENTVRNHLRNILGKLHLQNRTQAAAYALREGLVENPPDASS